MSVCLFLLFYLQYIAQNIYFKAADCEVTRADGDTAVHLGHEKFL